MRSYQVSFFDHRPDAQGNIVRCHQRTFLVKKARNPKHALKKAIQRFERIADACDWRLHTGFAEISTP
jgi:hypothetical protein